MKVFGILGVLVGLISVSSSSGADFSETQIAAANNSFGVKLFQEVAKEKVAQNPNQNLFLSPLSATMALSMLLNGARSQTYAEMAQALGFDQTVSLDSIDSASHSLLDRLENPPPPSPYETLPGEVAPQPFALKIANSVWSSTDPHFHFDPSFESSIEKYFEAVDKQVDFSKQSGVDAINGWVSDATNQKIPSIVSLDELRQAKFVLVNATYFKANWRSPFDVRATQSRVAFTRADKTTVRVDMMKQGGRFTYHVDDSVQMVSLPYADSDTAMIVALPLEGKSLDDALLAVSARAFGGDWQYWPGTLMLPKFGFHFSAELNNGLMTLGMRQIFAPQADFSGMCNQPTHLDLIKQDSFVSVDEHGTEAAAATVAVMAGASAHPQAPEHPFVMNVDRPFAIGIVDQQSGALLFLGTIADPNAK